MKKFFIFFLIFLLFSQLFGLDYGTKILVDVKLNKSNFTDSSITYEISKGVVLDILSKLSDYFTVVINDKSLFEELRLQDFLTTKNIVFSQVNLPEIVLQISIDSIQLRKNISQEYYIENSYSGNYIKDGDDFIEIYLGQLFSYNYENKQYLPDKDGNYVKGKNNKYYYRPYTFYSYFNHTTESWELSSTLSYRLSNSSVSNSLRYNRTFKTLYYVWDERIDSPSKVEISPSFITSEILSYFGSKISDALFTRKDNIVLVDGYRNFKVILDSGKDKGIREGSVYSIDKKAYFKIVNVSVEYSEGEIIRIDRNFIVEPGQIAENVFYFDLPISLETEFLVTTNSEFTDIAYSLLVGIGLKQKNIYGEPVSYLIFSIGFLSDLYKLSTSFRLLGPIFLNTSINFTQDTVTYSLGLMGNISFFKVFGGFEFDNSLSNFKFNIAGGLVW